MPKGVANATAPRFDANICAPRLPFPKVISQTCSE
jgi:hypothetical protein